MNISIPELTEIKEQNKLIIDLLQNNALPEWITLEKACVLKGCNLNTTKNSIFLQPKCSQADKFLHGRKVWHKTTILHWLNVTDDNREEYVAECLGQEYTEKYIDRINKVKVS